MAADFAEEIWDGPIADGGQPHRTMHSVEHFAGKVWAVRTDTVDFDGQVINRDVLVHPGAVAVVALDEHDRILLIRQYRHAIGQYIFEPPAGLLDHGGEPPLTTAARELAEESGYQADSWHTLVDFVNSPGGSSEAIRVYLARQVSPIDGGRPQTGEAEEDHLPRVWVSLDEARDLVLSGAIGGPSAVVGILAAWTARAGGWQSLRSPHEPWRMRAHLIANGRVAEHFKKPALS